jgi:hypothetical protein
LFSDFSSVDPSFLSYLDHAHSEYPSPYHPFPNSDFPVIGPFTNSIPEELDHFPIPSYFQPAEPDQQGQFEYMSQMDSQFFTPGMWDSNQDYKSPGHQSCETPLHQSYNVGQSDESCIARGHSGELNHGEEGTDSKSGEFVQWGYDDKPYDLQQDFKELDWLLADSSAQVSSKLELGSGNL